MINNRQGNRRRGRGGQRPQNIGGRPDGNRQDNRQRGNAAQLLEKYKSMARDSQLAGDRVQTEYYLQFADHYFRVLGENRPRFEDQRPQRSDEYDEDGSDEDQFDGDGDNGSEEETQQRPERQDRQPRPERNDRPERPQRDRPRRYARDDGGEDRPERSERPERQNRIERDERPLQAERNERPVQQAERSERPRLNGRPPIIAETLPFDALPPAIGATVETESGEEEVAKPRRRTRRPRPAGDEGEIAPAA